MRDDDNFDDDDNDGNYDGDGDGDDDGDACHISILNFLVDHNLSK